MTICGQITTIPAPESSIRLVKQDQIGHRSFLAHRKQLLALARVLSGLWACNQDLRSQGWKSISVILSHSHTYFNHLVLHSKILKIHVISHFIPHFSFHSSFLISFLIAHFISHFISYEFRSFRAGFFKFWDSPTRIVNLKSWTLPFSTRAR